MSTCANYLARFPVMTLGPDIPEGCILYDAHVMPIEDYLDMLDDLADEYICMLEEF